MSIITIDSNHKIQDIDNHFKISAGPGAGKTYWLVNHIKNILNNSEELSITRKVACITYTNIAVETILNRLGTSSSQVDVSTIHSFLYKHIVKPYVSFVAKDYELDISKMDGHDEVMASFKKVSDWIENHPDALKLKHPYTFKQLTRLPNNKEALINFLSSISYKYDEANDSIVINIDRSKAYYIDKKSRRYLNKKSLDVLESNLIEYKKKYWREGKVSHDDVLFFSFQIIKKYPFAVNILKAKFPYLLIDEFQDSNPIQVAVVKVLGLSGIKTSVIGDPMQSIYGFQGANYNLFNSFALKDIFEYTLNENRRSSNEIIDVLDLVRTNIKQVKQRNISIAKPLILIGDMTLALKRAKVLCQDENVNTLSRNNITSNAMKAEINGIGLDGELLSQVVVIDSNRDRKYLIFTCIKAIAYAKEKKFKDAIKVLEKHFNYKKDKIKGKRKALRYLTFLLSKYDKNITLIDFSEEIRLNLDSSITKVTKGKVKTFYENNILEDLIVCVNIPEDISLHKTIHKAKGDEFNNVLLVLKDEKETEFLTQPNLIKEEEHRINYVAISRAKNKLFISLPSLSNSNKNKLKNHFDFEVV